MKKIIPPILALVCTIIFFSCGKETQSTTQGGGICKIKITISPEIPITSKFNGVESQNSFISFWPLPATTLQWSGASGYALSTIESPEFSVTKGQNVSSSGTSISNYDGICRTVNIECFVNNKSVGLFTKELGIKSTSPYSLCKDQGNSTVNFIIP